MIVPATVDHVLAVRPQPSQAGATEGVPSDHVAQLVANPALAVVDGHRVLAVGGIVDMGEGRGVMWSLMADSIGSRFVAVYRAAQRLLREAGLRRVEMIVDPRQVNGVRLAIRLGFDFEALMRSYYADGHEAYLFARIA